MSATAEYVSETFKGLEEGDGASFVSHVDDKVDWNVEGTHPLAGHYHSKAAFIEGTFMKLGKVLPKGAQLHGENLLVSKDDAVVELHSLATAKNGLRFDNRYCWVIHFQGNTIDVVRAYLDSAMVTRLFEENPISRPPTPWMRLRPCSGRRNRLYIGRSEQGEVRIIWSFRRLRAPGVAVIGAC